MTFKIGLDIDDTLARFFDSYKEYFNTKKYPARLKEPNITKNVVRILKFDKDFWLNLPVKHTCNFIPTLYCTSRVCNKDWSKKWLLDNGFPNSPVHQIFGHKVSKVPRIKGKVDLFIDDSLHNFIDLNLSGIPCLLIDSEYNQWWKNGGRIHSLDIEEISEVFNDFKNHEFLNFADLI